MLATINPTSTSSRHVVDATSRQAFQFIDLQQIPGICHGHGQRSMDSKHGQHAHLAVGDQHIGRLLLKESKCLCTFYGRSDFKASPCQVEPYDIQEKLRTLLSSG